MKVYKSIPNNGGYMVWVEGESDTILNHDGPNANRWVKEEDALAAIDAAHKNGIAQGVASAPTGSWTPPSCKLRGTAADVQVPLHDTRTNQLLNELYHDRARLERQVQQACELMRNIEEYATKYNWVDDDGERIDNDYPLFGSLEQFVDTHEGE